MCAAVRSIAGAGRVTHAVHGYREGMFHVYHNMHTHAACSPPEDPGSATTKKSLPPLTAGCHDCCTVAMLLNKSTLVRPPLTPAPPAPAPPPRPPGRLPTIPVLAQVPLKPGADRAGRRLQPSSASATCSAAGVLVAMRLQHSRWAWGAGHAYPPTQGHTGACVPTQHIDVGDM